MPGPPASRATYSPKGNAATNLSRRLRGRRENHKDLSGYDFSHSANAGNSIRLQPLRSCFPSSLNSSRTTEKLRKTRKNPAAHPPNLLRLNPTPILYFEQLARNFNRTMLRLKINENEQKSKPETTNPAAKKGVNRYADPPAIHMAAQQRRV